MSNSLWPNGLQNQWCHPTISSSVTPFFSFCLQSFIKVFSNELTIHNRWSKYWRFSFSISPSNVYSGWISFKIDWFDLLLSKGCSKVFSSTTVQKHQFFGVLPSLRPNSHILHDYWKDHSLDYTLTLSAKGIIKKVQSEWHRFYCFVKMALEGLTAHSKKIK